jgi:molybdopterin biosynthesis enzyme
MSKEWAHIAARKEVPTVNNVTPVGYAVASSAARGAFAVAGTRLRGEVSAQLVTDGSGFVAACTALPGDVVAMRPQTQLQKYPFMTHGAAINGAKLGPHRAWDPV